MPCIVDLIGRPFDKAMFKMTAEVKKDVGEIKGGVAEIKDGVQRMEEAAFKKDQDEMAKSVAKYITHNFWREFWIQNVDRYGRACDGVRL